jgi:hypothetical protein
LTVLNVTVSQDITANFALDQFTVTFAADPNGSIISGSTSQLLNFGTTASAVTASAVTAGYHFVNWTDGNGIIVGTNSTLTLSNVRANRVVTANFENTLKVNFFNNGNGGVSGNLSQTVVSGQSATQVQAVPAADSNFVNWTGTGGFVSSTSNPLNVNNVTADMNITANFAIKTFAVNFAANPGGSVTPPQALPQTVNYGASTAIVTAVPNSGFVFLNWTDGTGAIVGTNVSLSVTNITAGNNISANFTNASLNVSLGTGVTGPSTITYGGTATYTIAPPTGYSIQDVLVNGVSVGAVSSYVVTTAIADQTILATYSVQSFVISMDSCITGSTSAPFGSLPLFQFNPPGFMVVDVQINGVSVGSGSSYAFPTGISANQTIRAKYAASPTSATPVRLIHAAGGTQDVSTLQAAYDAAATGDTILLQAGTLAGPLLANRTINVMIKGGYEGTYTSACSPTSIQGLITIRAGAVRVQNITR